jgi:hypothetical protein
MGEALGGKQIYNEKLAISAMIIMNNHEEFKNMELILNMTKKPVQNINRVNSDLIINNNVPNNLPFQKSLSVGVPTNPPYHDQRFSNPVGPFFTRDVQNSQPKPKDYSSSYIPGVQFKPRIQQLPGEKNIAKMGNSNQAAKKVNQNDNPTAGKQICDYERKYIDKENFGVVSCPEKCRVCNECRAENTEQCVLCEGLYSESQKLDLNIIKQSIREVKYY